MATQVSWRAEEDLIERARARARELGKSLNQYVTEVVAVASNPDFESDEAERLRARLALAGLLTPPPAAPHGPRPDDAEVVEAGRRAGRGTALSDLVSGGR